MIKEMELEGKKVLELTRYDRIWYCSECSKEFMLNVPVQCSCGAQDKTFMEKTAPIPNEGRMVYRIKENII